MERKSMCSSGLEWEDLALYSGKPIEFQEQICFSMSSSGSNALCGNDLGTCSSSKYPISCASHESTKPSMDYLGKVAHYKSTYEDLFSMHNLGGTFSSSPAGSVEPTIGLRLGIPKEYGDSFFASSSSAKSSVSSLPVSSFPMKRSRASYHSLQNPCCQVEGCNLDLKSAKDYHRRHRICENHSKSPKVIVSGLERRFCQQCSRFHELSEFDDKKRSCRRRLSDHNARRRRVQPESFQLNSQGLPSALYGASHKMEHNLLLNGFPISQTGALDGPLCFSNDEMRNSVSSLHLDSTRNIMDQGLHIPTTNSPIAPDLLGTAPSLLSSNTWTLNESETSPMQVFLRGNYLPTISHLNSESYPLSLFHPNNTSVSLPVSLMNTVNVTTDHPPEYQLFNSGNYFSGNP